jgi:hypothetical protein
MCSIDRNTHSIRWCVALYRQIVYYFIFQIVPIYITNLKKKKLIITYCIIIRIDAERIGEVKKVMITTKLTFYFFLHELKVRSLALLVELFALFLFYNLLFDCHYYFIINSSIIIIIIIL